VDQEAWNSNWYRERASNEAAMTVLKDKDDGTFVIRDSTAQAGSFALSYRFKVCIFFVKKKSKTGGFLLNIE
jgi:hypothetical protein